MRWLFWRKPKLRDAANVIADAVYASKEAERVALEATLKAKREAEDAARDELVNAINHSLQASGARKYPLGITLDSAISGFELIIQGITDDMNGERK